MRRLTLTNHTVTCPVEHCAAQLVVRTDPKACPSRRHRDVTACSLFPSTSFVPSPRSGFFSDVPPPMGYSCEEDARPRHSTRVPCSKPCLDILNAAEAGTAEPIRCTWGIGDAMEMARQTQSPGVMRAVWFHSV